MYLHDIFLPSEAIWRKIRDKYEANEKAFDFTGIHGWMHAYRCCFAAHALLEAFPDFYRIEHPREWVMIAVALHDIGRKNNGTDIWEPDSAAWCAHFLTEHFPIDLEESNALASCIIKDKKALYPSLQSLIHDADVLDYSRLLAPSEFNFSRLHIVQNIGTSVLPRLKSILEQLVAMQEDEIYMKMKGW